MPESVGPVDDDEFRAEQLDLRMGVKKTPILLLRPNGEDLASVVQMTDSQLAFYLAGIAAEYNEQIKPGESPEYIFAAAKELTRRLVERYAQSTYNVGLPFDGETLLDLSKLPMSEKHGLPYAGTCPTCRTYPVFIVCPGCQKNPLKCDCGTEEWKARRAAGRAKNEMKNALQVAANRTCENHPDQGAFVVVQGKPLCEDCYRRDHPDDPFGLFGGVAP